MTLLLLLLRLLVLVGGGVVAAAPEYCPVLVSGAALAGHRSVEGGVEVGRTVGSGISEINFCNKKVMCSAAQ